MNSLFHHVAKRAAVAAVAYRPGKPDGNHDFELPPYAIASLIITGVLFLVGVCIISYTYNQVIATLAMVESPVALIFESVPSDDPDGSIKKRPEADLVVIKQVPITSSLRATIRHLRQHGGYASRFRGASLRIIYTILLARLIIFLQGFLPLPVAATISCAFLSRLELSWTHIVITKSSPRFWFKRLASLNNWKKIVLPTAIVAILQQAVLSLNMRVWYGFGLHKLQHAQYLSELTNEGRKLVVLKLLLAAAMSLLFGLAIILPAQVALRRVQASLLPEDQETVVNFDRTFGGKISGGMIGMLNALVSFDWNSRVRLIKIYLKVAGMQLVFAILFVIAILAELRLFLGNDFEKIMDIFNMGEAKVLAEVDF